MSIAPSSAPPPPLKARRLGFQTQNEPIALMRSDCHVCRAEGLSARSQIRVTAGEREIYAVLFQLYCDVLARDEVAFSEAAWKLLGVQDGDPVSVSHPPTLESLSSVRRRIYGHRLSDAALGPVRFANL